MIGCQGVRQDVPDQRLELGHAQRLGRGDEVRVAYFYDGATGNTCHLRPGKQRYDQHHCPHAPVLAEQRQLGDDQGAEDQRQREEDVAKAGQDGVQPATVVASQCTEGYTDDQHAEHGQDANGQ